MNEELLLRVRADLDSALAGLGKLGAELDAVVQQATKAGASFDDMAVAQRALTAAFGQARTDEQRAVLAALSKEVEGAQQAMRQAAGATGQLGSGMGGANRVMIDASRIVNDLQVAGFGGLRMAVIATANNIDPFVQSLRAAKAEAAATNTTLTKSLIPALVGGGGLVLGIQAVIAAGVLLGPKLAEAFGVGEDAALDFSKSMEKAADSFFQFEAASQGVTVRSAEQTVEMLRLAQAGLKQAEFMEWAAKTQGVLSGAHIEARARADGYRNAVENLTAALGNYVAEAELASQFALDTITGKRSPFGDGQKQGPRSKPRTGGGGSGSRAREISDEEAKLRKFFATVADGNKHLDGFKQTIEAGALNPASNLFDWGGLADDLVSVSVSAAAAEASLMRMTELNLDSQAYLAGTQALAYGLADAMGNLAALRFDAFADSLVGALRDTADAIARTIAHALALRGILALIGLIPGVGAGWSAFLGGALGVPGFGGGNATAGGPAALSVTFGGASYRNGGIYIPASVVHAANRDAEATRGRRAGQ